MKKLVLGSSLVILVAVLANCGSEEGRSEFVEGASGSGADAGVAGGTANDGGAGKSGAGGAGGTAGGSGAGGTAGSSGAGGAGGKAGSSGAGGTAGSSGAGGAGGKAGSAGAGGTAGSSGAGGTAGKGGSAGAGGTAGSAGAAGTAGSAGAGGTAGSAGAGGTAGSAGGTAGIPLGNPDGKCAIPAEGGLENVSSPKTVVGTGTPASCTSDAFVKAVAQGGVITFNCGANPVVITLSQTAKIFNDKGPKIVIDGGGKVTLSGGGKVRILYMNTCDQQQVWTTSHCNNQDSPQLTVQNLDFIDGNSKAETQYDGGGAIWARGGRFKAVNTRFFRNLCAVEGPDVGGAAIRVFDQYNSLPVYIVNSTFGGKDGYGNIGSNGGALSSIGVSYTVINSLMSYNQAIGNGMNPAKAGTPGGGSGGAIYNDGNTFALSLCGTKITNNSAVELGGAIFFVSNNLTGAINIDQSVIQSNPGRGNFYKGIYAEIKDKAGKTGYTISNSTVE